MSIPRAKIPSSDVTSTQAGDSKAVKKPVKTLRKPLSLSPAKSRIPAKQGKISSNTVEIENAGNDKQDDKPSTPNWRPSSKSQDKPPSADSKIKPSLSLGSTSNEKRVWENQFNIKRKRYMSFIRDIEDKQKSSETTYQELQQLREKILASGGKDPGKLEELAPPWSVHHDQVEEAPDNEGAGEQPIVGKEFVAQLETRLNAISEFALVFCREVLGKRAFFIEWLENLEKELAETPDIDFKEKIIQQLEGFKTENTEFHVRLESARQEQIRQITSLVQQTTALWRECQSYRQERRRVKSGDNCKTEELTKELRAEKDKLAKARAKIREQEHATLSNESKLRHAQESIKSLEAQIKQKDASIEQKNKELAKFQKSHEATLGKLEKQKDTVENRVSKLKEEIEFKENESKILIHEYKKQVEEMENELEAERKMRQELDRQFEEFKIRNAKLEDKCKQLLEMNEKAKDTISDDQHTQYEIQLFNDLQEIKSILVEKEELIKKLQQEREEIIVAANEADQENDTSNKRLALEIFTKCNEYETLRSQFTQLQKNYKRMQQKSEHLEQKLSDMNRLQQVQLKDGSRAAYGAQMMQMQQQITDLSSSLAEANAQNEELEKTCTQLQLKLEHYKRYIRNQDKDLKVRKEMQQLLQHKDPDGNLECTEQNYNSINVEDLYATLENKEMQVMKLEKLVKQMEKQEEYSQAQRTRHESRIATLEVQLKKLQQDHRNRGFSFL